MKPLRQSQVFLSLFFLAILFAPGLIQFGIEIARKEPPQVLDIWNVKPTSANLRAYEKSLEDSSWVARQLGPWMQFAQFHILHDAGDKGLVGHDGWFFYRPGVDYLTRRPPPQTIQDNSHDPLPAILRFREDLAERGIRLLLLPVPNKESVYPEKLSRREPAVTALIAAPTRSFLDRARAAGVEVIDLFDSFAKVKRAAEFGNEPLYLAQDSHWSPVGVRRSARLVADWLIQRGWVERGTAEFQLSRVPTVRLGDVLRMLQSRQIERSILPEAIICEKVVGGSGPTVQNGTEAQVLILGDSFLRIFENDEPGSAGFLSHLARELRQPIASLVSDGGASTLVRQELHRRPGLLANKKVLIWEFVERDIGFGAEGWQIIPLPGSERQ